MQERAGIILPLVSVIIPSYNSGKYISDMLLSVYNQTYTDIEIIFVNDGSTDDTDDIILKNFQRKNFIYISKTNSGVSDSRNKGFQSAKGKYILFLDSDDILSSDFLEKRVNFLEANPDKGFCTSAINKIDENSIVMEGEWIGPCINPFEEILLYKPNIITCPSSILIVKSVLDSYHILFNNKLSSSADRFFLLELSKVSTGGLIKEGGKLFYRVHSKSMSNTMTIALCEDTEHYFTEVIFHKLVSKKYQKKFVFNTNYIMAGNYWHVKKYRKSLYYLFLSGLISPYSLVRRVFIIKNKRET